MKTKIIKNENKMNPLFEIFTIFTIFTILSVSSAVLLLSTGGAKADDYSYYGLGSSYFYTWDSNASAVPFNANSPAQICADKLELNESGEAVAGSLPMEGVLLDIDCPEQSLYRIVQAIVYQGNFRVVYSNYAEIELVEKVKNFSTIFKMHVYRDSAIEEMDFPAILIGNPVIQNFNYEPVYLLDNDYVVSVHQDANQDYVIIKGKSISDTTSAIRLLESIYIENFISNGCVLYMDECIFTQGADTNGDGKVDSGEMVAYIGRYSNGEVAFGSVIEEIDRWVNV